MTQIDRAAADPYFKKWELSADGAPSRTHSSLLVPVFQDGTPCMLKISHDPHEIRGAAIMAWWNGDGAARVIAQAGDAVLLERATGNRSLLAMASAGGHADDEATRTICGVLERLHAPRGPKPAGLQPLPLWFNAVFTQAERHGGPLTHSGPVIRQLLAEPCDEVVLHGDAHHSNILDFGPRGWLAIDPKDRFGERIFDYVQTLGNPDLPDAADPARMMRQAKLVSTLTGIPLVRLLRWTVAGTALTAAWTLEDDDFESAGPQLGAVAAALGLLGEVGP